MLFGTQLITVAVSTPATCLGIVTAWSRWHYLTLQFMNGHSSGKMHHIQCSDIWKQHYFFAFWHNGDVAKWWCCWILNNTAPHSPHYRYQYHNIIIHHDAPRRMYWLLFLFIFLLVPDSRHKTTKNYGNGSGKSIRFPIVTASSPEHLV